MTNDATLDQAVRAAIAADLEWQKQATPSAPKPQRRVMVRDGDVKVMRRPFVKGGYWVVRWMGVARLTAPKEENGWTVFTPDWSRATRA